MKIIILFMVAVALAGCGQEEVVPEATAATCEPETFQKIISDLRSDVNRISFTEACKEHERAKEMRTWEFKPSTPDRY